MDIASVASQVAGYLGNNPDLIAQFVNHPYSTTAKATGSNEKIYKEDMSKVVTQVAAQSGGQAVGGADVAGIAAKLLGQNGGSVHQLAGALFGNVSGEDLASMTDIAAKSAIGGAVARGAASLITGALGTNKPQKKAK